MARQPDELLESARGRSLTEIAKTGIGGWMLALAGSVITGTQELFQLLIVPIDLLTDFFRESVYAIMISPLQIVEEGSATSAEEIQNFGIMAVLVGLVLVLGYYFIIQKYLAERETTDVPIPGASVDLIPFVGVEEEANEDD